MVSCNQIVGQLERINDKRYRCTIYCSHFSIVKISIDCDIISNKIRERIDILE